MRKASTTAEYYKLLMRFAAELRDGHTNVFPPEALADDFYRSPGIRAELIGDSVVITAVRDPTLKSQNIVPGLKVMEIDGRPVRAYAEQEVAPYISASTPQDRAVRTYSYFLLDGPANRPVRLLLEGGGGKRFEASLPRIGSHSNTKLVKQAANEFKLLPGDIAYLTVNEFEDDAGPKLLLQNFAAAQRAQGLIIDVRNNGGGSSEYGYQILQMLDSVLDAAFRELTYNQAR